MRARRDASLLRLQQGLMGGETASHASPVRDLLPFEAARACWTVPCAQVARVLMPAEVVALGGYPQLPSCVVGVVAGDSEMLSVVDAGLLLGRQAVVRGLKSRLIVFNDGPLKGIALLVERVHDRVAADAVAGDATRTDAASLHASLQEKTESRSVPQ